MLTRLLSILAENQGEIDLLQVSRRLGAQPGAVAGMLETLIRKGRVVEVGSNCGICETCPVAGRCTLPVKRAKRYRLVAIGPPALPALPPVPVE